MPPPTEPSTPSIDERRLEEVPCKVCGSEDRDFDSVLVGYRFHRCRGCGLVYMSPRPSREALEELYDESYFESDDPNVGYALYEKDRESVRHKCGRLLDALERHGARGALLDIGCAHGFLLEAARERGFEVVGVEPAAGVADRTSARLGVPVERDLFEARFEENRFDVVAAWDVIEHVLDPRAMLAEVQRILEPGGLLSLVTPDVSSLAARVLGDRWEEKQKMPEHICFFDRRSLKVLFDATGFEPLEWGTVGKLMHLDEAFDRMTPALPRPLKPAIQLLRATGLGKLRVHLDPRWKLSVVAKNVGGRER